MAIDNSSIDHAPHPNPALARLERLVGAWDIRGRTFNSATDDIRGKVVVDWLPGGFFLELRGELESQGFHVHSLEIVGYDAATKAFSAHVYSSMGENAAQYQWDIQGDTVTHWTQGSRYTGEFSPDGNTLSGRWRPDEGEPESEANSYEAIMTRIK